MDENGKVVELYRRYRPKTFKEVFGQMSAVSQLEEMLKKNTVPHAVLFSGPSGVGKTTLARILAKRLGCSKLDYYEINVATDRGIDAVRSVKNRAGTSPMGGSCRVWVFDEVHAMTKDGQTAMLKMLEDTQAHVYYLLCTTDPTKLLPTIRTRCTEVRLSQLASDEIHRLLVFAVLGEKGEKAGREHLSESVYDGLVELADGSARKALVLLHQILDLPSEVEQLAALDQSDSRKKAIDIARALIDRRVGWDKVAKMLKELDDEPETTRRVILGYYNTILLGGGRFAGRASELIYLFGGNYYDNGKAGLTHDCYKAMQKS